MIEYDELTGLIQRAANMANRYSVPRLGLVTQEQDSTKQYRFVVQIPSLGWDTDDTAAKCNVIDIKGYTAPAVGDYVIVQFVDGNRDFPVIVGSANYMKDMITKNHTTGTDVLYSRDDEFKITYDGDQLLMGNTGFQPAARQEDATTSSSTEDSTYWAFWTGLIGVFKAWVPVPNDGGAALKTALTVFFGANPTPTSQTGKINAGSDQVQIGDK